MLVLVALALWWWYRAPITVGTFNIRMFPEAATDRAAVARAIGELDVDAFAIQEIGDPAALEAALRVASERTGRTLKATLMPYCHLKLPKPMYLGVVVDTSRVEVAAARSLGAHGWCEEDQPAGMVALLRAHNDRTFALAAVHLKAGGRDSDVKIRKRQWAWLTARLPGLRAELGAPVVLAGDFNSTGYLVEGGEERRFIDEQVAAADLQVATGSLGCSMYWQPKQSEQRWESNLLDHVVAPRELELAAPEALGMCARLACAEQGEAPPEWRTISDHCPVRVELR